ncbi:MAG: gamma-glutamylcyclotransferase [Dehalococcoidia bacterium]|nr:gamma-glutamylcyclotransferase [Dehalococcoidia bacterium]
MVSQTPAIEEDAQPFLYFAFGSNLDEARLHIHCPSARFVSIARLADHRLAFTIESRNTWHGGVADILAAPGAEVWGALWVIAGEHSRALDEQEGVFREPPAYRCYRVTVETRAGDSVTCRAYQVVAPNLAGITPSPAYKATILRGARAIALPPPYLDALSAIEDNGHAGGALG